MTRLIVAAALGATVGVIWTERRPCGLGWHRRQLMSLVHSYGQQQACHYARKVRNG